MPPYLSPGVYVEEVPSAVKPIAGVSTSTAGFIGVVPNTLTIPVAPIADELVGAGNGTKKDFDLAKKPALTTNGTFVVRVNGAPVGATNDGSKITITGAAPANGEEVRVDYVQISSFTLPAAAAPGEPRLCTNFSEYTALFGDFSTDLGHRNLTHAVYGFFNNGGSSCYVMRVAAVGDITNAKALVKFEGIDDIAIVAAPGITDPTTRSEIDIHCRVKTQDRFAIFDSPEVVETSNNLDLNLLKPGTANNVLPANSDFAAFYFPWIRVFDPATKLINPGGDGGVFTPPSGHLAGIYARTDTLRGVHKAPANEAVLGALGTKYRISKAQQDNLNPQGVNCIRELNGAIYSWGGRTIGGNANLDLKYINVRRTLLFLRESIDEGLQWAVFEPNNEALWQKITRNVSAFLTDVWRSGALFGSTPQQAFYVKCDAELNTPSVRDNGQVITEIGVAIVRPAEFVIFRISQFTAPGK